MRRTTFVFLTAALVLHSAATMAADPVVKCKASKNKIAGAYYACREKAEATAISKNVAPNYSKCIAKFDDKWGDAEDKGGCPDTVTTAAMRAFLDGQTNEAASIVAGTTGIATCDAPLACPAASDASRQTICGQLFDLEDGSKFQATDPTGTECSTPTVDGPCSLSIVAYDAVAFGSDPLAAAPLAADSVYIDDCGRYRVTDVAIPSSPFITLAIDDADGAKHGPTGSTNTVAVTTPKQGGAATTNFDGWVGSKAMTDMWEVAGPTVSGGLYVAIFYEQTDTTSRDLQDGVTLVRSGSPVAAQDHYFVVSESARHTVDASASSTGANGTVLVTGASVSEGVVYSGSDGNLSPSCVWETHAGASLPSILSVQEFRPKDAFAQTCDR